MAGIAFRVVPFVARLDFQAGWSGGVDDGVGEVQAHETFGCIAQ